MLNADVLLLSAGFGKRLRPLTEAVPKPLIEVAGRSLLEWNLLRLAQAGFTKVFVNTHYLADLIEKFLDRYESELRVELVREEVLLDTGGALRNIESRLEHDTVLVVNSDILLGEDFDFGAALQAHQGHASAPIGTLVLRADAKADAFGSLETSAQDRIVGFLGDHYISEAIIQKLMFLGVSVWDRRIFDYMPQGGVIFSLTKDVIPELLNANEWLHSIVYRGYWSDVGTLERLEEARATMGGLITK